MMKVSNVYKKFRLYHSPADRLKEIVLRKTYHREITALSDVSFEVQEGETLGIVGQNGAGKSTLLKILSGVLIPDNGYIQVDGKITGLLELGTGFNPELTGIENIYMNGTLLGLSKEEIDRKKETIMDFAELGDFIYEPIKTYSSGMLMRLAFSTAMHAEPKCFLVDEALSVGDAYFQQKCMRKILEFKNSGGSIIFVSHDMNAVKTLCDSAIFLDKGQVVTIGSPKDIVDYYQSIILQKTHEGEKEFIINEDIKSNKRKTSATGEIELISFQILNDTDEPITYIESEKNIKIEFAVRTLVDLSDPHFGFMIRNRFGLSVFETNTYCMGIKYGHLKKGQIARIKFSMKFPLSPDDYSISIGVAQKGYDRGSFEEILLFIHDIEVIKVIANDEAITYSGFFNMVPSVDVSYLPLNESINENNIHLT